MGKAKKSAERYALFIRAFGFEPTPYRLQPYDKYAAELQLQYLILKRSVGPEIAARVDPQRKKTQSWAIERKDRKLFGMAGLWENWNNPTTRQPLETTLKILTFSGLLGD